ncbi:type I DNA topoisomerase [Patescibacteria group bacterium]
MQLIIVESPTKSKTISKFLGKGYIVKSSYGHIRDLPKSELGVNVEKNFTPKYIIPIKARKAVKELKNAIKKADLLVLATDEDREGEAIAWHITKALDTDKLKIKTERIVFHEITKKAIEKALDNPRKLDMNLVDAQQARRILDRLVGYKLSPFLWKKIAKGLSAGRVQSVAVRLIVDREKEIEVFKPDEYWSIEVALQKNTNKFTAKLIKTNNKAIPKLGIKTKNDADKILEDLNGAEYKVISVEAKESKRNPLPPFTTSTLQQEASRKFGFSTKQTMRLAQQLYEGIKVGDKKQSGLITYHRTDSMNLSSEAVSRAREFIKNNFGQEYIPESPKFYKTKSKGAQEAHEAIRPTFSSRQPEKIKSFLDAQQYKLYSLIWQRFIACQMSPAILDTLKVDIEAKNYIFRANGSTIKFNGFLKVYPTKTKETILPSLSKNDILKLIKLISEQHFTQPPARYTEASLVKILEEYGIGRPSTYAPIISTIQDRGYVIKNEQKRFVPEEIGLIVIDMLKQNFPEIVDVQFTANMEKDLDKIADGKKEWEEIIKSFYKPFNENLEKKYESVEKKKMEEPTDKICPKCGKPIIIKMGRFGKFYSCSGFPECKHTEAIVNSTGVKCPECEKGEIVERRTRKGKIFYSCSRYPKCKFALWNKPTGEKCPECGSLLAQAGKNKIKCSKKECGYEKESEPKEE